MVWGFWGQMQSKLWNRSRGQELHLATTSVTSRKGITLDTLSSTELNKSSQHFNPKLLKNLPLNGMCISSVPKESINGSGIGTHDSHTLAVLCGQFSTACSHSRTDLPGWDPFSLSFIFSINLIFASCLLTK